MEFEAIGNPYIFGDFFRGFTGFFEYFRESLYLFSMIFSRSFRSRVPVKKDQRKGTRPIAARNLPE